MRTSDALLLILLVPAGLATVPACGSDAPSPLALRASEVRELPLLDNVAVVELTREEFSAQAAANAERITDESLEDYAQTYGRLGFFDMDLDLRPIFAGSNSDWVGAQYWDGRITLVGDADDDVIVHEYVHALQDQHFGIATYDLYDTSDGFLARRAIVEGDAVLAQYRFLQQSEVDDDLDGIVWDSFLVAWRDFTLEIILESSYPPIFLDYVSFTYAYGLEYSAYNLLGVKSDGPATAPPTPHDWRLQDALFTDPIRAPETTRQILELDMDGVLDPPLSHIGLSEVPLALDDRFIALDWDRMGEWSTFLMLLPLELDGTLLDARGLSESWLEDRVLFVLDTMNGATGSIWAMVWEDDASAAAMADAMRAIYGASVPQDGYLSTAANGEPVWIEERGATLVVMRNVAADVAPTMADAAFTGQSAFAPRKRASLPQLVERLRPRREGTCQHPAFPSGPRR